MFNSIIFPILVVLLIAGVAVRTVIRQKLTDTALATTA